MVAAWLSLLCCGPLLAVGSCLVATLSPHYKNFEFKLTPDLRLLLLASGLIMVVGIVLMFTYRPWRDVD